MRKSNKVIITCAPTGSIHTPSMSPHLPVTVVQIAEAALGAAGTVQPQHGSADLRFLGGRQAGEGLAA